MRERVVVAILVILLPFFALGAAAANFGAVAADVGSAPSPSSVPGNVGHGGNGADYVHQGGDIPTALIIDAPTTIYVNETLTVSLRLVRADTYDGIPYATVRGHFSRDGINWSEPGSLTTNGDGQFSYTGTVPNNPGTYQGYLSYNGDDTYQGCTSSVVSVTVLSQEGAPAVPTPTDSRPTTSPTPADSRPTTSPTAAVSSLPTNLKPTPISANATTNMLTSFTSSTGQSLSGSVAGYEMHGLIARGVVASAVVVVLKFRKKLIRI